MLDGIMKTEELAGIEKKALDQLLSGKSLFGKDGAFAPLLKSFIEKAPQGIENFQLKTLAFSIEIK